MAVSCSRVSQPDQLGLAVAVPRKLKHDDDAQAAAVGGDDEAVGDRLRRAAHAAPATPSRRVRRLLQQMLHVRAPLAVRAEDQSADVSVVEDDLLHRPVPTVYSRC